MDFLGAVRNLQFTFIIARETSDESGTLEKVQNTRPGILLLDKKLTP